MKLNFLFLITLFISGTLFSNSLLKIELAKGEKVEETFSAELPNGSLHLLFIKNKKLSYVELRPFYIDMDNKVKALQEVLYEKVPSILSFHQHGEHIFLFTYLDKNLTKLRCNLTDGKIEKSEVPGLKRPEYVLRDQDRTLFVRKDEENSMLSVQYFSNSLNPQSIKFDISKQ